METILKAAALAAFFSFSAPGCNPTPRSPGPQHATTPRGGLFVCSLPVYPFHNPHKRNQPLFKTHFQLPPSKTRLLSTNAISFLSNKFAARFGQAVIVAGAFYIVAKFSLLPALETTNATAIWPPIDIALAVVVRLPDLAPNCPGRLFRGPRHFVRPRLHKPNWNG